jgi:Flp pilus assembly protein protease CpaA
MEALCRLLRIDVPVVPFAIVFGVSVIAAITDVWQYKIPNWLTIPLVVSGFVFQGASPIGKGWLFAFAGFVFGLAILMPFFLLGGIGAGDVKLLAGIGSWLGLHDVLAVFLAFGSLTGVYSAVSMFVNRRRPPLAAFRERVEQVAAQDERTRRSRLIPLAPMMAIAIFILELASLRR